MTERRFKKYPRPWAIVHEKDAPGGNPTVASARQANGKRMRILLFPMMMEKKAADELAEFIVGLVNNA